MSNKVESLPPVKVKFNTWNYVKLIVMAIISFVLWFLLFFTGINILAYYIHCILTNGFFDPETLKYAVMIAVGAYFCLVLDKNKIYEALNVKRDLPFITIEQLTDRNKPEKCEKNNEKNNH